MKKNVFVVLGVARGGTSTVARAMQALGIELGERLVPTDVKWNAKGFFEDSDIVFNINGKAFQALNFAPYSIELLDAAAQNAESLQAIKQSAIALLEQRFANTTYWGFKDPSTVKLLSFWQSVFASANINDNYIICLRNPLGSAKSYQKLTGCSLEIGLLLWLMHMLPAIANTHNKKSMVVSYELLLQNPQQQLKRMQSFFELQSLEDQNEIDAYINEFLDIKLQHNHFTRAQLLAEPALKVVPLCIQVYDLLVQLANDEIQFSDAGFISRWKQLENELNEIYPTYLYLDKVLKENNQLRRQLKSIHKTWLWKLYSPIKIVYDQLRAKQRQKRSEKRLAKAYG